MSSKPALTAYDLEVLWVILNADSAITYADIRRRLGHGCLAGLRKSVHKMAELGLVDVEAGIHRTILCACTFRRS